MEDEIHAWLKGGCVEPLDELAAKASVKKELLSNFLYRSGIKLPKPFAEKSSLAKRMYLH